ncbi:LemA family protein [Oscillospiraceae bacterium MB08-C2-2]|nr:LemA family protein [Oscillospiraceae bacterium MB08-C2-2]
MKKGTIILLVIIGIVLVIVFSLAGTYNGMVASSETVQQSFADVQADLQRRNDLIPNLVATVKGFATHEEEIYTSIADARSKLMGAGSMQEVAQADSELSSALSRLLVVVENYPELKANQNFLDLQTQLEGTENRIKVSRQRYNEAVRQYNGRIRRFPSNLLAGMFGFDKMDYFEAEQSAQSAPTVDFSK